MTHPCSDAFSFPILVCLKNSSSAVEATARQSLALTQSESSSQVRNLGPDTWKELICYDRIR